MPSRSHAITGSAKHAVSQLWDLLGLGFTGFNFIVSGPNPGEPGEHALGRVASGASGAGSTPP